MDIHRSGDLDCGCQVEGHDPSATAAVTAVSPADNCNATRWKIKIWPFFFSEQPVGPKIPDDIPMSLPECGLENRKQKAERKSFP